VKEADNRMCILERDQLMKTPPRDWHLTSENKCFVRIDAWSPQTAKRNFLVRYRELVAYRAEREMCAA
jgi:hypothetical protein